MLPLIDWQPRAALQRLHFDWLQRAGVEVAVLRLDQIDPLISGNKWFKLTEHLAQARDAGASGIISLGGAYSNHLHALAAAGNASNKARQAACSRGMALALAKCGGSTVTARA